MKILFIGSVDFSRHCLETVLEQEGEVVGIVTRHNDGLNADFADLGRVASKYQIPVHYTENINSAVTIDWVKSRKPDIVFCFGWSQLLKEELISLPSMGVLGAHPAMLPKNRGRHPIIWSLVLGLKKTGLTFFFIDSKADAGPILSQKELVIDDADTAFSLYEKIKLAASELISEFMPKLLSKTYTVIEQDESVANTWRKRTRTDGVIDWRMSAEAIHNLVRALSKPYPGAEFAYKEYSVKVWSTAITEMVNIENMEPGKVVDIENGAPVIKCQDGALRLLEYEPKISLRIGEYL